MKKACILVVDDDVSIRKFVRANLDARDYDVLLAANGTEAIKVIDDEPLDLIILDIMMPEVDGFEVCRHVREQSNVPIVMLSAKDGENDKLRCLELGADDYLTKPFSLKELLCKVKIILRRVRDAGNAPAQSRFSYRDLEIDYNNHIVYLKGQEVNLTGTEYQILTYLAQNAGRVIAPQFILEKIWGQENMDKLRRLWVNISRLRSKLKSDDGGAYIYTKPGIGYLMK